MVEVVVLCNWSPACTVKYRQSTIHATMGLTLTPCKSMQGGLGFQGDSRSFHTGVFKHNDCVSLSHATFTHSGNASAIYISDKAATFMVDSANYDIFENENVVQIKILRNGFRRGTGSVRKFLKLICTTSNITLQKYVQHPGEGTHVKRGIADVPFSPLW